MHIFNVRKGFATNSSSSHSVIELKEEAGKYGLITDEYTDFGWEFFTASNVEAKQNYISAAICENLKGVGLSGKKLDNKMIELVGKEIYERSKGAYIDHQSMITLPRSFDNKELNSEFIQDLLKYIENDQVVILGGNDNSDHDHELLHESIPKNVSKVDNLKRESYNNNYIARKDKDYWSIFSRTNGEKVRFSFISEIAPTKAYAPELADIKITDFCPYACDFCYQDSTLKGQHASMENLEKIANELEKAQVYEVALGGGETTLHPQFVDILKLFKSKNIIPNFTTKNYNLLRQSNAKDIVEHCGAMAFSVQSVSDMLKVKTAFIDYKGNQDIVTTSYTYHSNEGTSSPWNPKITFQMVMGVMEQKEFEAMINLATDFGARVTLLGYKENGRGSSFAPYDYSGWLDFIANIKEKDDLTISIDTALATEFENELLAKGIDNKTFHTNEGAFSVYIDAVKMKFYPSSYVGLENSKNFNEEWLKGYEDMNVKPTVRKGVKVAKNI